MILVSFFHKITVHNHAMANIFVIRQVVSHGPDNNAVVELRTRDEYGPFLDERQAEECAKTLGDGCFVDEAVVSVVFS
jgi:hypothetical protein